MKQTTLTNTPPMILDSTCSFGRNWPRHATIRMDYRPEVKPDVVGDIRKTNFEDNTFDKIYCDPPHMIRKDPWVIGSHEQKMKMMRRRMIGRTSPDQFTRYSFFKTRDEWIDFLEKINNEMFRILKPGGLAIFKLTFSAKDSRYIKRKDMNLMTNFKLIDEKKVKSKIKGSKNFVHYITLRVVS